MCRSFVGVLSWRVALLRTLKFEFGGRVMSESPQAGVGINSS
jgi:hypothetical protein